MKTLLYTLITLGCVPFNLMAMDLNRPYPDFSAGYNIGPRFAGEINSPAYIGFPGGRTSLIEGDLDVSGGWTWHVSVQAQYSDGVSLNLGTVTGPDKYRSTITTKPQGPSTKYITRGINENLQVYVSPYNAARRPPHPEETGYENPYGFVTGGIDRDIWNSHDYVKWENTFVVPEYADVTYTFRNSNTVYSFNNSPQQRFGTKIKTKTLRIRFFQNVRFECPYTYIGMTYKDGGEVRLYYDGVSIINLYNTGNMVSLYPGFGGPHSGTFEGYGGVFEWGYKELTGVANTGAIATIIQPFKSYINIDSNIGLPRPDILKSGSWTVKSGKIYETGRHSFSISSSIGLIVHPDFTKTNPVYLTKENKAVYEDNMDWGAIQAQWSKIAEVRKRGDTTSIIGNGN